MAIKIAGTTVVDNSRGLTNIASVDATTATAIGAAGVGGGGTHEFVASGAISNGDVVVVNADGTVSVVAEAPPFAGTPEVFESARVDYVSAVLDISSNKVVVFYTDAANSYYGTAVVGTVSGTSISFGTPVVFKSAFTAFISSTYDSNTNKIVTSYRDDSNTNYGTSIVGTVSGTSISFGTPVVFESSASNYISSTFDSSSGKVIIAYQGNANDGKAVVATVSGTSISFGTPAVFDSGYVAYTSTVKDSNSNKIVIAYTDVSNSNYGTAVVGTVSGTSISYGTPVVFESAASYEISAAFDSTSNKAVIAYKDAGNGNYGTAIVGTVSGTSVSFGTPVVFETTNTVWISATFDANSSKVVIAYSSAGSVVIGTVSGTSISFGTPIVFESSGTSYTSAVFDSNSNKIVIAYQDSGNSNYGTAVVFEPTSSTNASSYIGIAAEDIADTATGEITIIGGVVNVGTFSSYDIANASYDSSSFSVSSQVSVPYDVAFDSSGTIMYILSWTDKVVYQYTLSTAYDISTASYGGTSFTTGLSGIIYGMHFSPDGTKMFVIDNSFARVHSYSLSTSWDVSTASLDSSSYTVYSQVSGGQDVALSPDGTKMYVLAGNNNTLYQYTLATAFDLSAVSYSGKSLSVTSQGSNPNSITFNGDGTKLFILINNQDSVFQYSLSTAYDISTASYDSTNFSVATQETTPLGLAFSSNGVKMFVVGNANDTVFQYTTGSAPTANTSYFVANDGTFSTTNNGRKIGKAISSTELQVKTKLTGSEMNEYLGGLV